MIPELKSKYEELENSKRDLIKFVDSLEQEKLNTQPEENKWSIVQIIFHLVKTERIAVITITKGIKNIDSTSETGLIENYRSLILLLSLRLPFKYKAPTIMRKVPEEYEINELKRKWEMIRNQIGNLLKEIKENDLNKIMFEHPYSGKMNIVQTLNFLNNHLERHFKQIKRTAEIL